MERTFFSFHRANNPTPETLTTLTVGERASALPSCAPRRAKRTADSGNISLCLSLASETRDEDLVVLVNEVQASIVGNEGGDCTRSKPSASRPSFCNHDQLERTLLSVLDELNTDTLSDGRVGLLGLNSDLLEHDALGVRGSTGGGRAVGGSEGALLVVVVGLWGREERGQRFVLASRGLGVSVVPEERERAGASSIGGECLAIRMRYDWRQEGRVMDRRLGGGGRQGWRSKRVQRSEGRRGG